MDANGVSRLLDQETEEYEPFDARLNTKVTTLQGNVESETQRLTTLRRDAPAAAAAAYRETFERELDEEESAFIFLNEACLQQGGAALEAKELKRQEQVEGSYERGCEILVRLKGGLPATTAKLERAVRAAEYVESRQ
jgi:kinetochor protein Mis14/NSL1